MTFLQDPSVASDVPDEQRFVIEGVHHLALVCSDMSRTVEFYENVLGFPLVKTVDFGKFGQHFFFEYAPGMAVAYFWYPDGPEKQVGISTPGFGRLDADGEPVNRIDGMSAVGSMHHVAFGVAEERLGEYRDRLRARGVAVSDIVEHGDTRTDPDTGEQTRDVYLRSIYFTDPDGLCLEFTSWTRPLNADDVVHVPANSDGRVEQPPAALLRRCF